MPGRRPLVALLPLSALALSACLHVDAHVGPKPIPITTPEQAAKITAKAKAELQPPPAPQPPPQPRADFAVLPKVPGTVVQTKPDASPTALTNVSQKPTDAVAPPTPPPGVKPAGGEPAAFPLLTPTSLGEPPLLAAVRAYSEGRPEQAIEAIRKLDRGQQDFVLAVLPILARGATADLPNDPATAAALVDQLRAAAGRLEPLAALKIEKAAFCSDLAGFGRFVQRSDGNPYRPNERVHLYLEVRNLGHQLTADGFLTHYHGAVEIRNAKDEVVAQIDPNDHRRVPVVKYETKFVTRSPLHDLHVLYSFAAPTAPGVYTITYQLTDATGRRTVKTAAMQFLVAGPG